MKIVLTVVMTFFALSAFANIERPSLPGEKKELCHAIDKALEEEQADMAVDIEGCGKAKMTTLGHYVYGTIVQGTVPFRSPNRNFKMHCQGVLAGGKINSKSIQCKQLYQSKAAELSLPSDFFAGLILKKP